MGQIDAPDDLAAELAKGDLEAAFALDHHAAALLLRERAFAAAILDLSPSGERGCAEPLAALAAIDPVLPVIVTAGPEALHEAIRCLELGAFDVVEKPYDPRRLGLALQRALRARGAREIAIAYEWASSFAALLDTRALAREAVLVARHCIRSSGAALALRQDPKWTSDGNVPAGLETEIAALAPSERRQRILLERAAGRVLACPSFGCAGWVGELVWLRDAGEPPFAAWEIRSAEILASQLGLAVDNAKRVEALTRRTHELTAASESAAADRLAITARFAQAVVHEIGNPLSALALSTADLRDYGAEVSALWAAARRTAAVLESEGALTSADRRRCAADLLGGDRRAAVFDDVPAIVEDALDATRRMTEMTSSFASLIELPRPGPTADAIPLARLVDSALVRAEMRRAVLVDAVALAGTWAQIAESDGIEALARLLISLDVETREEPLEVELDRDEGRLCLSVRDPELVMSAEELTRIFDPELAMPRQGPRTLCLDLGRATACLLVLRNAGSLRACADERGGTRIEIAMVPADPPQPSLRP